MGTAQACCAARPLDTGGRRRSVMAARRVTLARSWTGSCLGLTRLQPQAPCQTCAARCGAVVSRGHSHPDAAPTPAWRSRGTPGRGTQGLRPTMRVSVQRLQLKRHTGRACTLSHRRPRPHHLQIPLSFAPCTASCSKIAQHASAPRRVLPPRCRRSTANVRSHHCKSPPARQVLAAPATLCSLVCGVH